MELSSLHWYYTSYWSLISFILEFIYGLSIFIYIGYIILGLFKLVGDMLAFPMGNPPQLGRSLLKSKKWLLPSFLLVKPSSFDGVSYVSHQNGHKLINCLFLPFLDKPVYLILPLSFVKSQLSWLNHVMGKSLFLMVKSCLLMDLMLKSPGNGCFTGPFIGSPGRTRCFGSGVSTGRRDSDVPLQNANVRRYSITIQNGEAFTRKNGRCSSPMCEFFRGFRGKNKDSKSVSLFAKPTIYF